MGKYSVVIKPKDDGSGLIRVTVNQAAADKLGGAGTRCSVRRLIRGQDVFAFVLDDVREELQKGDAPGEYVWEGPPRPE